MAFFLRKIFPVQTKNTNRNIRAVKRIKLPILTITYSYKNAKLMWRI